MIELLAGEVFVHYGFMILLPGGAAEGPPPELMEMRAGQRNGLCGAAVPGVLSLITGTHTGHVPVRVRWHDAAPELDPGWEDVVEVPFRPIAEDVALTAFDDYHALRLPAAGDLRVRYCAAGMDAARDADRMQGEPPIDRYQLDVWPAQPAADVIVRQTSEHATYWHRQVHDSAEVAEPPSDDSERNGDDERLLLRRFGGRTPGARLRSAAQHRFLEGLDLDLTFALAQAGDDTHRQVAAWAALRAVEIAGLAGVPELGPSIAAMRRGEPAVAPFADELSWYEALKTPIAQEQVPALPGREGEPGEEPPVRQWNAIAAVTATAEADSLTAALGAIESAATSLGGDLYADFLTDLKRTFPQLETG